MRRPRWLCPSDEKEKGYRKGFGQAEKNRVPSELSFRFDLTYRALLNKCSLEHIYSCHHGVGALG